ncbi:hypothetical protein KUL42_14400 [Alteromonas sp. KUL42]|nr:hypothetical protein KUL42_14400 [Alteromonas sp. KUL42]
MAKGAAIYKRFFDEVFLSCMSTTTFLSLLCNCFVVRHVLQAVFNDIAKYNEKGVPNNLSL